MDILTKKITTKEITNGTQLNEVFNLMIQKIESNYDRSNKILLIEILKDYYLATSILESTKIISKREVNYFVLTELIAKIKSVGILKSSIKSDYYIEYTKFLVLEVQLDNSVVSGSLEYILSTNYIINLNKESLKCLNNFWANYLEILVNLHQYTEVNIETNIRIAESYKNDLIKINSDVKTTKNINLINAWFKEMVDRSKLNYIKRS